MKTVFTNSSDVIHLFAQRTQDHARCSNVFFEYNKIYSYGYHYILAEFLDENTILINDRGHSNTTAKHISQITSGTRQYKQFFTSQTETHKVKLELESLLSKLATARKPENYILPATILFSKYTEFKKYRKTKVESEIKAIYKQITGDLTKYKEKIKKERKRKEIAAAKELKTKLTDFYTYEIDRIYGTDTDFLRLSQCGEYIETTQQIQIKVKDAKILANLIQAGKDIKGYILSGYRVIKNTDKVIQIGCHNITKTEVNRIINLIN